MINRSNLSYLDRMRLSQPISHFTEMFHNLAVQDRQKAFMLLNDERLMFPCLFILMNEIIKLELYDNLNKRNAAALKICAEKTKNQELLNAAGKVSANDNTEIQPVLRWMFKTGVNWDGPDEDYDTYDAIIDYIAVILIRKYKDKTILPDVAELIFRRNRKGLFIHDLVWSFFQSFDPYALRLIAKYLLSSNHNDTELACKLLHLNMPQNLPRGKLYNDYMYWLKENSPFLYSSGEYFQSTSDPEPLKVNMEAKYLCKKISQRKKGTLEPLTEKEKNCLCEFQKASKENQKVLSAFSHKIHGQNMRSWDRWISKQLDEQVSIAKSRMGGNR